jgi:hypothetical protein
VSGYTANVKLVHLFGIIVMKKIVCTLLLVGASQLAISAELLYRQGFETPVTQNPEIQWLTHGYEVTQAIVDSMPKEGNKSVRGNFNPNVIDPIAKIQGNPFTQLKLNFAKVPQLKNWYPTARSMYVSWWFKLDKCHWKGTEFNNNDPLEVAGKFAYIRMNENPSTSYYFTIRGGEQGSGTLSANQSGWMKLWETLYGRSALYLSNEQSFGSDGKWHKLGFFIETEPNGNKYLTWWIDDVVMSGDRFGSKGRQKIYDGFVMDSIQFWHTKAGAVNLTQGACNGWQIDDVQVWDGVPNRPRPPSVN